MHARSRAMRGFTLIEQLISLAVAATLVGMAVPAMQGLRQREGRRQALQSLVESIRAARMLSINRQRRALLCPSSDGRHCSGGRDWQQGWLVALDSNHDGQPDATPSIVQPAQGKLRIIASRSHSRIYYHPNGSAPGSNQTLRFCPPDGMPDKVDAVVVSNVGRIRVTRVDGAPCARGPG